MQGVSVVLFAVVAVASAGIIGVPGAVNLEYAAPQAAFAYSFGYPNIDVPFRYAAVPIAHSAPIAYTAPVAYTAPAIQPGYVAATRGSVHTAPLPEGPFAFSHHINTAPAPGTV